MSVLVVGSVNADLSLRVVDLPDPGATVIAEGLDEAGGGKGANQAVAAARWGAEVAFVGAVGTDAIGPVLREELAAEGIDVGHLARLDGPSGRAIITVDAAGENHIVVVSGANGGVEPATVTDAVAEHVGLVLVSCELSTEVVRAALHAATGTTVLNPAPAVGLDRSVVAAADVVVPNRGELAELTGTAEASTITEAVHAARALGVPSVVVTLGGDGCVVVADGEPARHLRPPAVEVVDTTGAGDTFCGVLAAELSTGADVLAAAVAAVDAAARSTTAFGARAGMPRRG